MSGSNVLPLKSLKRGAPTTSPGHLTTNTGTIEVLRSWPPYQAAVNTSLIIGLTTSRLLLYLMWTPVFIGHLVCQSRGGN